MQRKKYENPLIVEELVFQIAPELLDRYLEGDFTCLRRGWKSGRASWALRYG